MNNWSAETTGRGWIELGYPIPADTWAVICLRDNDTDQWMDGIYVYVQDFSQN
ncbi:MAG: hypothetical protein ACLFQ6_11475 [Candidatus Sumerlaeia bacterium]